MSFVTLAAELRQELRLNPQLLQSMEVLQMTSQELLEYLERVSEENPMIESEDALDLHAAYEELQQKVSWLNEGAHGASFRHNEALMPESGRLDPETEGLAAFLCDQLDRARLPKPLLAVCKYLAELVDENGYLSPDDLESLTELEIPRELMEQALETIQGLEPAGVGARDLSECLRLQLVRKGSVEPYIFEIVCRFLPELGRKHYGPICRELGVDAEKIQAAEKLISSLEPHPGLAFQLSEPVAYVRPDVFVLEEDGGLKVVLNEYYLPRISINDYYSRLLKEPGEKETHEYLQQKMQQAKWLLNSLERRGSTLRRCAEAVLNVLYAFFSGETSELAPMNLSALAEQLGLHVSTVSRAMRGKYLQCRRGTYPLRYFFNHALIGGASRQAVKQRLLALIGGEDRRHPLSDQELCRLLSSEDAQVARRTVAKYRLELGIPSSTARKQR